MYTNLYQHCNPVRMVPNTPCVEAVPTSKAGSRDCMAAPAGASLQCTTVVASQWCTQHLTTLCTTLYYEVMWCRVVIDNYNLTYIIRELMCVMLWVS